LTIYVSGRLNVDYILMLQTPLIRGEKAVATELVVDYGGSGGNVATAIVRFIRKPGCVRFVGCVGSDVHGKSYVELLKSEGVDTTLIRTVANAPTGLAIVLVEPGGIATVISYRGANEVCSVDLGSLNDMKLLVLTNPPIELAYKLIDCAIKSSSGIVVDPSRGWTTINQLKALLEAKLCILAPNDNELMWLTGTHSLKHAIFTTLRVLPSCKLAIKRGSLGVLYVDPDQSMAIEIPALPVGEIGLRVLSTAGCGDTFTGVLSAALYEGWNLVEALQLAVVAAGIKATRLRTRDIPYREEVIELYERVKTKLSVRERKL